MVLYNIVPRYAMLVPCPRCGGCTLEKGKAMATRAQAAYNNATHNRVSKSDLSAADITKMERVVAEETIDGPGSLPYALLAVMNTSDWKPWQFIQVTQELS